MGVFSTKELADAAIKQAGPQPIKEHPKDVGYYAYDPVSYPLDEIKKIEMKDS